MSPKFINQTAAVCDTCADDLFDAIPEGLLTIAAQTHSREHPTHRVTTVRVQSTTEVWHQGHVE